MALRWRSVALFCTAGASLLTSWMIIFPIVVAVCRKSLASCDDGNGVRTTNGDEKKKQREKRRVSCGPSRVPCRAVDPPARAP